MMRFIIAAATMFLLTSCGSGHSDNHSSNTTPGETPGFSPDMAIVEKWKNIKLIDAHNHDAEGRPPFFQQNASIYQRYYVDKIVLFGEISRPAAVTSDALSWQAYQENSNRFIPFFSGFEMHDPKGIDQARANLDKGYKGIGEVVAASYYSPAVKDAEWKAIHPMDGNLPGIYQLCADYDVPILLHIDPLNSNFTEPVDKLEIALQQFQNTKFILGHGNVYNTLANVEHLLKSYNNITIDFYAGFTRYDAGSSYSLKDWADLIKRYPDRFVVSTDSGYGIGEDKAFYAIYELMDIINDETVAMQIAHQNLLKLLQQSTP